VTAIIFTQTQLSQAVAQTTNFQHAINVPTPTDAKWSVCPPHDISRSAEPTSR